MARVTFHRSHPRDVRQRQVVLRVDEGTGATLLFGDRYSEELSAGSHTIRAHNTLFRRTMTFDLAEGEHAEFDVINHSGRFTLSFLAVMGVAPLYLAIERRPPQPSSSSPSDIAGR
jgi:hypothetical protein